VTTELGHRRVLVMVPSEISGTGQIARKTRYRGIQMACLSHFMQIHKFILEKGGLHIPVFGKFLRPECQKLFGYRAS
jgi:hypothetical protein